MNTTLHWTSYLSALLTPVVAIFGIYIARRQAVTAQNKLKFELFQRRFSVYDEARAVIEIATNNGNLSEEMLKKFINGTGEARWLFDKPVDEYLRRKLGARAYLLTITTDRLNTLSIGEERSAMLRNLAELQEWFHTQQDVLDSMLGPYLELHH